MKIQSKASLMLLCLMSCLLVGCAVVGPRSIKAGRVAYAEAINQTQDEQILLAIVKGRYGQTSTLLEVNSVIANLRFRAEAGVEAGFRGAGAPGDDLLIGGLAYEENPTITYAPVQGEDYIQQLYSPVPLDLFLLMLRSTNPNAQVWTLLVNRINGLRNPEFLRGSRTEPDPRFVRLTELLSMLANADALDLVKSTNTGAAFGVWLNPRTDEDATLVAEVLELLELPSRSADRTAMLIPVYFGIRADDSWGIGITTRSTFNLAEILRASVEVPEKHAESGLTEEYPPAGLAGRGIGIHSSPRKPEDQSLMVKYRGHWFWIDDTDRKTKSVFRLMRTLWSISIANSDASAQAPSLTLPVGN